MVDPFLKEVDAGVEVLGPRGERLHREEALLVPDLGYLVVEEGVGDQLQLLAHDDETLEGLFDVDEVLLHDFEEPVVADDLLHQDGVHRLLVAGRVPLLDLEDGKHLGGFALNEGGNVGDDILSGLSCARACFWLHRENGFKHVTGLSLGVGDFGVVVHSEGLRGRVERKLLDVFDVLVNGGRVWLTVEPGVRELVAHFEDVLVDVDGDDGGDEPDVLVVCDPSAVVDLRPQEV
jgi:hypothetical protein